MLNFIRDYKNVTILILTQIFLLILSSRPLLAVFVSQESDMMEELETTGQPAEKEDTEILERSQREYNARGKRDPFESPFAREEDERIAAGADLSVEPPSLTVQGVVWGGTIPQAIINHKVVKKGDIIEEAEILEISKEGVTVIYKKRIFKLSSPAGAYWKADSEEVIK